MLDFVLHAPVVQGIEHLRPKEGVGRSNRSGGAIFAIFSRLSVTAKDTKAALPDDQADGQSASSPVALGLSAPALWVALICLTAFLLRCVYIVSLDHLLCQFGDAYFFLAGGSKLRQFICAAVQAGNFNLLSALPPASGNAMVALGSLSVSDRLMVDGPVFPSYLALVQWLVGLAPGSLLFDSRAVQISLANALLDSLTCLLYFWARGLLLAKKPLASQRRSLHFIRRL